MIAAVNEEEGQLEEALLREVEVARAEHPVVWQYLLHLE